MFEKILVPLDGSGVAAQALPVAALLASALQASLILVTVLDPPGEGAQATAARSDPARAQNAFETELRALAGQNVKAEGRLRFGKPAAAIMDVAREEQTGLIVMATHGRTGLKRIVLGSVTDAVVRQCEIPVLVLRAAEAPRPPLARIRRILVPLDGSPLAEAAIGHAGALARALAADIVLFSIWDTFGYELSTYPYDELEAEMHEKHAAAKQYLIAQTEKLTAQGISARWQLRSGLVVEQIVEAAEKQDVDLIVMSTHARHGLDRWLEGTVAGEVMRSSAVPALLIRMPEVEPARPA